MQQEKKLKILELFGGIGACTKALKKLNIDFEIADYVEIDKYAVKSFNAINGTSYEPQDICKWDKDIETDLIMHGSPCQDFSLAGKGYGGNEGSGTRSSLMYETIRIVEKLKPKYIIWENVKNVVSKRHIHNFYKYMNYLNKLGYTSHFKLLNSKDYGIPQNRNRLFVVSIRNDIDPKSFKFPEPFELKLKLKDLLEPEVDEKYYLSEKMINYISFTGTNGYKNSDCRINLDVARPLTTDPNKRAGTSNYISKELPDNYDLRLLIKNATIKGYEEAIEGDSINLAYPKSSTRRARVGKQIANTLQCNDSMGVVESVNPVKIRKLTPKEYWRLMGFDNEDYEKASKVNSNTQLYKQAGNSIVVNVLEGILEQLLLL